MTQTVTPATVRDYWLNSLEPKDWYVENPEIDAAIRAQFLPAWETAADGGLQDWLINADDLLAYIILCDQFPRNMFRGDGRSFATDKKARAATHLAIANGWDLEIAEPARQFIYVTLMHSEDLTDQDRALEMFSTRMPQSGDNNHDHGLAHRWVIATFGRFPYRNAALDRETTPEEQAFLDKGGYRFALQTVQGNAPET